MLIFTYGSMMSTAELKQRCPTALAVCNARLLDHKLRFNRESETRGGGVASVVHQPNSEVWGVVYDIIPNEIEVLDRHEGFKQGRPTKQNCYQRIACVVMPSGDAQNPLEVQLYQANPQANPPLPNKSYIKLLIEGAEEHGLPAAYRADLATLPSA
jgi:gamma-glutamylcyclotransferase